MALVMNHIIPLILLEKAYKSMDIPWVLIMQYYVDNQRKEKCECLVYDGSNKEVFFEMYVKFSGL
jgi:hypothetical protein